MTNTKKKIFIVIAILVVVVGIVGIIGYLLLTQKQETNTVIQQEEDKETSINEKKNSKNVSANPTHKGAIFDNADTTLDTALKSANSIYVSSKYAYVTSYRDDGVEILDISDPSNPTHVGAIFDNDETALDYPASVYVSGKYAYVASMWDSGVEILPNPI